MYNKSLETNLVLGLLCA